MEGTSNQTSRILATLPTPARVVLVTTEAICSIKKKLSTTFEITCWSPITSTSHQNCYFDVHASHRRRDVGATFSHFQTWCLICLMTSRVTSLSVRTHVMKGACRLTSFADSLTRQSARTHLCDVASALTPGSHGTRQSVCTHTHTHTYQGDSAPNWVLPMDARWCMVMGCAKLCSH